MSIKKTLLVIVSLLSLHAYGQTVVQLLSTKDDGSWPCVYYLLNSNDELQQIDQKDWTGRCTNESDWAFGYGPFSNSLDAFLTTPWGSQVQPILIRRHFTLTSEDMAVLSQSTLTLSCSYDENPHFYLNGASLWSYTGWNDNDYVSRSFTSRNKLLLREGDNVLSVSLMQGQGGGHIDFGLVMVRPEDPGDISTITADEPEEEPIYNIGGIPETPTNGIYVSKNKKFTKTK